ncbi:uncharacterized protein PAC_17146 [Phialocephala subalpina]|uniref:Uncharacterized protein n=1 Tax=Phialocephala subalpina TaxID=576137 RepID=A0A1L7XQP0_9HELO|nr:uncharacterized protein PAC_17146 [Phialocephala subalpina]
MATPTPTTLQSPSAPPCVANEKRRRARYCFSRDQITLRTKFPGHRARYLSLAGIYDARELYQRCADLWPEYFSPTSSTPYSSTLKTLTTKGLLGIAFKNPDIDDFVEVSPWHGHDILELVRTIRNREEDHVERMWREYGISVATDGVRAFDVRLVREGRDRLRVKGYAHVRLERMRESGCFMCRIAALWP